MTTPLDATTPPPLNFQWVPQPDAQKLVDELLEGFLGDCPAAACLAGRMLDEAGTRFFSSRIGTEAGEPFFAREPVGMTGLDSLPV